MSDQSDLYRDAAAPTTDAFIATDAPDKLGSIAVLNDLIDTCRDGVHGFEACAEYLDIGMLKRRFYLRVAACRHAADDLASHVVRLGGQPNQGGSSGGAGIHGWLALRGALNKHSEHAILEACERGEDLALTRYRRALAETLPPDIRSLIQRQLEETLTSHDEIKLLREAAHSLA